MDLFTIIEPKVKTVPLILSVPHCGVNFPDELKSHYDEGKMAVPDDTDWFVHKLYSFASAMGITIIHANLSRWVIDLNRDPDSKPLYDDGRIITALTTSTDFFGNPIYKDDSFIPDTKEVGRRLTEYYWPYYRAIENLIEERKKEFGKVILWDAHSIRRHVPTIRKDPFPDMILGTNDETSAQQEIMDAALNTLRTGNYQVNYNDPFKGGHITRYFGKPEENQHALQLEMNKILYMDDEELKFHPGRAEKVQALLMNTFNELIKVVQQ
jgi:N-formylglutamate deformylase